MRIKLEIFLHNLLTSEFHHLHYITCLFKKVHLFNQHNHSHKFLSFKRVETSLLDWALTPTNMNQNSGSNS